MTKKATREYLRSIRIFLETLNGMNEIEFLNSYGITKNKATNNWIEGIDRTISQV